MRVDLSGFEPSGKQGANILTLPKIKMTEHVAIHVDLPPLPIQWVGLKFALTPVSSRDFDAGIFHARRRSTAEANVM